MLYFIRLAAVVAAAWILSSSVFAQVDPGTDAEKFFVLLSDSELTLAKEDLRLSVWGSDPSEPNAQPVFIETQPGHGSLDPDLSAEGQEWTYIPDEGFFGRDGFEYRVGDRVF